MAEAVGAKSGTFEAEIDDDKTEVLSIWKCCRIRRAICIWDMSGIIRSAMLWLGINA